VRREHFWSLGKAAVPEVCLKAHAGAGNAAHNQKCPGPEGLIQIISARRCAAWG
jgi:hypothetical protein